MMLRRHHALLGLTGLLLLHCRDRVDVEPAAHLSQALSGGWVTTENSALSRVGHTITPMLDGRLLLAGGSMGGGTPSTTVELYDPVTDRFSTGPALPRARTSHAAALLHDGRVLLAGGNDASGPLATTEMFDPLMSRWRAGPAMGNPRWGGVLVALVDGRVLAAGGFTQSGAPVETEILDVTGTSWMPGPSLGAGRFQPCAALLSDGRVMIAGGRGRGQWPRAIELVDVDAGTVTQGPTMATARSGCSATLLVDGRVLIAGGTTSDFDPALSTVELFDPALGTVSPAAAMHAERAFGTSALLPDGSVLVVGGGSSPFAERFDPVMNAWALDDAAYPNLLSVGALTSTGWFVTTGSAFNSTPTSARRNVWTPTWTTMPAGTSNEDHTATLMPDGVVLLAGGASTEVKRLNPATGMIVNGPALSSPRSGHTATLLPDGRVLVVGGTTSDLLDAAGTAWNPGPALSQPRSGHTATLLADGRVLVVGGGVTTEMFAPAMNAWMPGRDLDAARSGHTATLLGDGDVLILGGSSSSAAIRGNGIDAWLDAGMVTPRSHHSTTVLPDGRVLVVGGEQQDTFLDSVQISDAQVSTWMTTTPLPAARAFHTATLLPDGRVLIAGGENDDGNLADALIFDVTARTWTAMPALARTHHRATTLPDGKVLLTGSSATSELFDVVGPTLWPSPVVTGPSVMPIGRSTVVMGTRFAGPLSASNGSLANAAVNHPVATLETLDGLRIPAIVTAFSDVSATLLVPENAPVGHAILRLSVGGASHGGVVRLRRNSAPRVQDMTVNALAGVPLQVHVEAQDDDGDALTWTLTAQAQHGTVTGSLPDITYTAEEAFVGREDLHVQVEDGLAMVMLTLHIDVTVPPPVILTPAEGSLVTSSPIVVSGAAVRGVQVLLHEGSRDLASSTADATGHFMMTIDVDDGMHTIAAVQSFAGQLVQSGERTFSVDAAGPVFSGSTSNVVVEATDPEGAVVSYVPPTAHDDVTGDAVVTCDPPPGTRMPLGDTMVMCSAVDGNGHVSRTGFTVNVRDTTAPTFTCPADVTGEAVDAFGGSVDVPTPVATDAVDDDVTVTLMPPSGRFNVGVTTVTVTATDDSGNSASCMFRVTITPQMRADAGVVTTGDAGTVVRDGGAVSAADASVTTDDPPKASGCACDGSARGEPGIVMLLGFLVVVARKKRERRGP